MATTSIPQNGRVWTEWRGYLTGSSSSATVTEQYRTHSVATVRTVGYDSATDANSAAASAASGGSNITATYEKDGDAPYWSVIVETDTIGEWTTVTPP